MSLIQEVNNGQIVSDKTNNASANKSSNPYDMDMFLNLLVAEMQYQDPLEPTNNTEYVSELASFSQIEATQAVQAKMDEINANNLVGKYVIIETYIGNEATSVAGKVDYVMKDEEGNYKVSVNDKLFEMSEVTTVAEGEYYEAAVLSETFATYVASLPSINELTLQDADKIKSGREMYDALTEYQRGFLKQEDYDKLVGLEKRLEALKVTE